MIRMRLLPHDREDTLSGYIFSDNQHARDWLTQSFVDRSAYSLEAVEVGERRRCSMCHGSGFIQTVKKAGDKMTVDDFLASLTSR